MIENSNKVSSSTFTAALKYYQKMTGLRSIYASRLSNLGVPGTPFSAWDVLISKNLRLVRTNVVGFCRFDRNKVVLQRYDPTLLCSKIVHILLQYVYTC